MKLEAKIGLFVLMGVIALFILSTQVTNIGKISEDGYKLYAYIDDATGLEKHSKVLMNGVKVGEIQKVYIEGRKVKVVLKIYNGVEVAKDSTLLITQDSVLGAKVINLVLGKSAADLAANEEITHYHKYASFDKTSDSVHEAAEELKKLLKNVDSILGEEQKEELKEMIASFRNLGVHLDSVVVENRAELKDTIASIHALSEKFSTTADTINGDLPAIMKKIDSMTTRLNHLSIALDEKVPSAVDKFHNIEDNVTVILEENRKSLHDTLTSANGFFAKGEDAFGKVDDLLKSFNVSELQVGLHGNYMINDAYMKSYGTIAYLPNPETYYPLDLVSMPDYAKQDENGTLIEPKKHEMSKFLLSAQYAKRYDNLLLRGGVIESTGGLGIDYFLNNDKVKLSAEVFDFNAVNDIRSENAHANISLRYRFLKHIECFVGYDNFLNTQSQNVYFGVGAKFIDDNLKYMLGSASMATK